jgi:ABC-2 type transport system ATP-binding protein
MSDLLAIEGLTKDFNGVRAVDGVSFALRRGEVLGFLGPNGAGKSTTMKMITGFLAPTAGTARIDGFDIQTHPIAAKQRIGYLPEGAPAYGDMTPLAFLNFIAGIRGLGGSRRRSQLDMVIERAHLNKVLHQPIDTLSKGFKRRVGLAQALLHDPQVLILDEPTDGLDPNQKFEVRQLIGELAGDKSIVISTHILEEVEAICSRAVIIASGKVVADGTPEELTARDPLHQAVTLCIPQTLHNIAVQPLKDLPGVRSVDITDGTLIIYPQNGADVLPAVGALAQRMGWPVEALRQERGRLDTVFRTITRSLAKAA